MPALQTDSDDRGTYPFRTGRVSENSRLPTPLSSDSPVSGPTPTAEQQMCRDHYRIVKFGNEFYVPMPTGAYAPGQYWKFAHDVVRVPR